MAEFVLKDTKIYIDGIDLSGKHNSIVMNSNVELKDKTGFGSSARKRLGGLRDVEISGQGFYDASSAYSGDKTFFDDIGSTDQICTIVAEGTALGNKAHSAQKLSYEYSPGFQVGEIASMNYACYGIGDIIQQRVMEHGSLSTSLAATVRSDQGYRNPQKSLYGTLHCVAGCSSDGQGLVVKVHTGTSSGFSSTTYSTSLKFTALTTASGHTAQWKTTNHSTLHNWYRISVASSGSTDGTFSGIVTLGIQ